MTNVLLIHYPYWVEQLAGLKFDLILAGHSHGGQVRLPFVGAVMVPGGVGQYDLGLFSTPSGSALRQRRHRLFLRQCAVQLPSRDHGVRNLRAKARVGWPAKIRFLIGVFKVGVRD